MQRPSEERSKEDDIENMKAGLNILEETILPSSAPPLVTAGSSDAVKLLSEEPDTGEIIAAQPLGGVALAAAREVLRRAASESVSGSYSPYDGADSPSDEASGRAAAVAAGAAAAARRLLAAAKAASGNFHPALFTSLRPLSSSDGSIDGSMDPSMTEVPTGLSGGGGDIAAAG